MLAILFVLLAVGFGQYDVKRSYNSADCSTDYISLVAEPHDDGCTDAPCTCVSSTCTVTTCNLALPSDDPPNAVRTARYNGIGCSSSIQTYSAVTSDACVNEQTFTGISSARGSCSQVVTYQEADCTGPAVTFNVPSNYSGCIKKVEDSLYVWCGVCFHEDTTVTYAGKDMNFDELSSHDSCAIPHVYHATGVKITTSCSGALRVTGDHLIYTQRGVLPARDIRVGDFLYQGLDETKECEVETITTEEHQKYYGLNCEESVVLANGYKASTFGMFPFLPKKLIFLPPRPLRLGTQDLPSSS